MSRIHPLALAAAVLLATSPMALAQSVNTRFGPVSVNQDVLMFRGRPVTPSIEGNTSLGLDQVLQVGASDAVIVRDNGGSACPVLFHVVMVSAQGAKASPAFGTCSEAAEVSKKGDGVSLRMPTVSSFMEQRAGKGDAGRMHVFVVVNGAVTDNGKPYRGPG